MNRKMKALASMGAGLALAAVPTLRADAASNYLVEFYRWDDNASTIATYTDKECTTGRVILKPDQSRRGVKCIRSSYEMDVYRWGGVSDVFNVPAYTEVRIPFEGADARTRGVRI